MKNKEACCQADKVYKGYSCRQAGMEKNGKSNYDSGNDVKCRKKPDNGGAFEDI